MKFKSLSVLMILVFFCHHLHAQFTPYFQNYSLSEYSAGNQNWGVSKADDGMLYFANNNGLLEYDGIKWDLLELPNKTVMRSVLAHKERIYTGSYEEFGYWKKDGRGVLEYKSLSEGIKTKISPNEEFWQILPFKDGVVFRSFLNIYIYKLNGEIVKIKPDSVVISCNIVEDKLYVATLYNGVFELSNDKLISKIKDKTLENMKVLSIVNYKGNLLLVTSLNGCFIYDKNVLKPINFGISSLIKQHLLNAFTVLEDGRMAFGTIKNGVYFTNKEGEILFHINKGNGLINNTVLSQSLDENNKLWLGLDNGIASVDLKNNNYFFNDVSGALGAVYDVINYKDIIYIGSNTGLFYLDKGNNLQFIKGSQGQVWNLKEIDGTLFCGHNEGTFIVDNFQLKPISDVTGGWIIKKVPEKTNMYLQGTYTGLVKFEKENGKWDSKQFTETRMPIKHLVFEDQTTAWVAHAYKGLYRIKFNSNFDSILSIENYINKGVFSDFNVRVSKFKSDICFKTNEGWLKYHPLLDSIVPYELLNTNFGKNSYVISEDGVDQVILKNNIDVISFKSFTDNAKELTLSNHYFKNKLIVGNENVSKISDSTFALNLNNGFMLFNESSQSEMILIKPTIEQIEIDKELIEINKGKLVSINLNSKVGVSVSSPKSNDHFFEYTILELYSGKWQKLEKNKVELSSLKDGSYSILFRTSNSLGASSAVTKIQIKVLPPWYKAATGKILYFILVVIVLGGVYYYNKQKVIRQQRLLKIQYAKEQQEIIREKGLENEKKIVQLKNETLRNEIKLKSKQLANTAMALVKKNETLQDIKKELTMNKDGFDNQYAFKKILKKVDNSIEHKDEWKVFESNFNQVHEDFFKYLKEKHPILTHNDLKICAYIKMNLSNKEIAPLMNVSLRGLETNRYRLKKKLGLKNDLSMTNYLSGL